MGAIVGFFTSKIAGPIFGGIAAVLLLALITVKITDGAKIGTLETANEKLSVSIMDPKTGYIARNVQCETNVATLGTAITHQSETIIALGKATADAQAKTKAAMEQAQKGLDAAQAAAAKIIALKPTGDICAAALDLARQP